MTDITPNQQLHPSLSGRVPSSVSDVMKMASQKYKSSLDCSTESESPTTTFCRDCKYKIDTPLQRICTNPKIVQDVVNGWDACYEMRPICKSKYYQPRLVWWKRLLGIG